MTDFTIICSHTFEDGSHQSTSTRGFYEPGGAKFTETPDEDTMDAILAWANTCSADHIRPSHVQAATELFVELTAVGASLDEPSYMLNALGDIDASVIGDVLLQLIGGFGDPDRGGALNTQGKAAALAAADALGPDHAQTLYHFAVLVTKLA